MSLSKPALAERLIRARYPRHVEKLFAEYALGTEGIPGSIEYLFQVLTHFLLSPFEWKGYEIPREVVQLSEKCASIALGKLDNLGNETPESALAFFKENHQLIKYGTRRWLMANPGLALEEFVFSEDKLAPAAFDSLVPKGLREGDQMLHLHIISNAERQRLVSEGIAVPRAHWEATYYMDMLRIASEMLSSNAKSRGLICSDSWVFDPRLYEIASDGKPYVSFDFLKDDRLVGERFFVSEVLPDNEYAVHHEFALRSERRKRLYEKGELTIQTFGTYYEKSLLARRMPELTEEYRLRAQ